MSSLVLIMAFSLPSQAPVEHGKPAPPMTLYYPKKGDIAFLALQLQLNGVTASVLSVSEPNPKTYQLMLDLLSQDLTKSQAEIERMAKAGDIGFLNRGTKITVLKTYTELAKNAVYPVEFQVLDGPAKGAVLWTPLYNISRSVAASGPLSPTAQLAKEVDRRKAVREKKARSYAANRARERVQAQQALETEIKLAPLRAQVQTEMLRQQAAIADTQASMARTQALQQLNAAIRQDRVNQAMKNGGVMFGPNGAILPGDPIR